MGGSTSKPAPSTGTSFLEQASEQLRPLATVSEVEAARLQAKALEAKAAAEAAAAAAQQKAAQTMFYLKSFGGFVLFAGLVIAIVFLIDYIGIKYFNRSIIGILKVVNVTVESFDDKTTQEKQKKTEQRIVLNIPFVTDSTTSGDMLPSLHDATTQSIVAGSSMPLSSDKQGAYGMQWWMFIKDWNYGYGQEKPVLTRVDPTNANIMNPKVTLHPTDNSMKVSVSVFPETEGGSSKEEPAPATSGGAATDDVYICEVKDLPLQKWFSVSVTVFSRNLDVYIDGKLVKSCLLSGIPKPATGDVALTPNGGFSGNMCNFNYYSRMLTPGDASNFFSAGTPCHDKVPVDGSAGGIAGSGYSVKFGTYDTSGKVIKEYKF